MAIHDATSSDVIYEYDVFLSFRGEARYGFTGHLYSALCKSGINAFIDEDLRIGDEIGPALLETIENSRMSIIVLSENYATSTWCLDELLKIIECYDNKRQQVLAIFYKVQPSDVQEQKNSYEAAMIMHERRFGQDSEKVKAWRSALSRVCDLSGEYCRDNTYESELIKKIVRDTLAKLPPVPWEINYKVGLDSRFEQVKSLMDVESYNTVCILEIYGAGGIGKTTFAKDIYEKIKHKFEAACFLDNVREKSNKSIKGLEYLQKIMLSKMDEETEMMLGSTFKGGSEIKLKLGRKRVLLVLDDVDSVKQLEALAGGGDWFGSGSRIIITTRDTSVLDKHEIKNVITRKYEMEKLNDDDSRELFCWHAFNMSRPAKNFTSICSRAISYAKGFPLALKVIGSNLKGKSAEEWEKELEEYEKVIDNEIQGVLERSYYSLFELDQKSFLDIACFFKGEKWEYIQRILKACDFFPLIRVFVSKCLVTIDENGCLEMHDLIQGMGREIVRQESSLNPGDRSRLWSHEEVFQVLKANSGSSKIEGIMLHPPKHEKVDSWINNAFKKMEKLRILIVENTSFSSGPSYLPNHLRLLDWKHYPSQSFPPGFYPKKIVAFNLRGSPIVQPFQTFEHVTYMNVSYCSSITQIPDVSGAKNLRELKLDRCEKLVNVDGSIGFLPKLAYLSASECSQLQHFVPIYLPSLEYLSFNSCRSLEHFPEIMGKMYKPLKIYLIDTSIKELPDSISNLIGLDYVEMTSCKKLQYLPNSLFMLPNLVTLKVGGCSRLPESFRRFEGSHSVAECRPNLKTLHFGNAGLLDEDLRVIIHSFPNLKDLNVSWNNNFASLPVSINKSAYLTSLDVSYCVELEEIPELPSSVQKVDARHCNSLTAKTSSMLWSQVLKEKNRLEVMMPKREIPKWFHHRKEGGFPVFRTRGKFPIVALAFVFGEVNDKAKGGLPIHWRAVGVHLLIEGEHVHHRQYRSFIVADNHVLLCDLRVLFSNEEWEGLNARVGHEHDWMTVQVDCKTDLTLSSWGVYVYNAETDMDDIQFISPSHPSSIMVQSFETSGEEKLDLNIPAIFEGFLMQTRDMEEHGHFDNMSPEFLESNRVLIDNLGKMSRSVMAQREKKSSMFNYEYEDDKEGDSMLQWIAEIISKDKEEEEKRSEEGAGLSRITYDLIPVQDQDPTTSKTLALDKPLEYQRQETQAENRDSEENEPKKKTKKSPFADSASRAAKGKAILTSKPNSTPSSLQVISSKLVIKDTPSGSTPKAPVASESKPSSKTSQTVSQPEAEKSGSLELPLQTKRKVHSTTDSRTSNPVVELLEETKILKAPIIPTAPDSSLVLVEPSEDGQISSPQPKNKSKTVTLATAPPTSFPVVENVDVFIDNPDSSLDIPAAEEIETSPIHPLRPPSLQTEMNQNDDDLIDIDICQDSEMEDSFEEVMNLLSGSHRSSPQSACSSTQQGQDSSDSRVAEWLSELQSCLAKPFDTISSDQDIQEHMMVLVKKLEPLRFQLPAPCQSLPSSTKTFLTTLSTKLPKIERVIATYDKKTQEKTNLIKMVTEARGRHMQLRDSLAERKKEESSLDKEIDEQEKKLEELRRHKQALRATIEEESADRLSLIANSKKWLAEAKEVTAGIEALDHDYNTAMSDKRMLESSLESLRNLE